MKKILKKKRVVKFIAKNLAWFAIGAGLAVFFIASFAFIIFKQLYAQTVYPGVFVNSVEFGGKTKEGVKEFFDKRNESIGKTTFIFKNEELSFTIKAEEISYGYNSILLANQAFSIGRSDNVLSNISLSLQAYFNGIYLPASYYFSTEKLESLLSSMVNDLYKEPKDALFTFQNGRVVAFRLSENGQTADIEAVKRELASRSITVASSLEPKEITINIPIKVIRPKITTDKANSLGIKELLANGTSQFVGSIPNRIYNITLAATRLNGILVEPDEEFSFNKALGDISSFTGYKQAYIISGGKTILGDGGGVCQVSTTFFRALLNAGLNITERNAHSYRVGYYEQDAPPGLDATIYVPTVDLKFKNDTGNYILIQSSVDPLYHRLTFSLYGTKDNREITISKPVIMSQTPPPEPLYQDDPNLAKGQIKQVDFAAAGASAYFTREVKKNGEIILTDKFSSVYRPWQAVYLRGTKE